LTGPPPCERLLARYNAHGPQALGDLRRRNGTSPSILRPDLLEKLKARLREPPPDGGLWTSPKVAAWMAGELGLAEVLPQRGWEALKAIGWSVQKPRPRHPASATPAEREAFKKSWSRPSPRRPRDTRTNRSKSGPQTNIVSG
jgi:transposase